MRARLHIWAGIAAAGLLMALLGAGALSEARGPDPQGAPEVFAEAIGQANLRGGPGVDYAAVGEIVTGTRYRVLERHTLVPWLRLEVPGLGAAWVFQDLVTVSGDLASVPGTSAFPLLEPVAATLTPPPAIPTATPPSAPAGTPLAPTATQTPAPTIAGPLAITIGEANLRFGPDVGYPVIVKVAEGRSLRILERHALVPWTRVALPESPTGNGWVFNDVIRTEGDLSGVPITSATEFRYPTLTPTPQTVLAGSAPWDGLPTPSGQLAATLGETLHAYLLSQGFAPYSERLASVFVLDLETGDSFTLNDGVAFSGMSLTKIPVLAAYFQRFPQVASWDEAYLIADTMMCSENLTTNALLERLGDGDALRGARQVTAFLQSLGLSGSFLAREFAVIPGDATPAPSTIVTGADQTSTQPDGNNQILPRELGWLLASLYQCAADGSGPLAARYPDSFSAQTCRKLLTAMDANTIGVFLEAGVPRGARVIHKHGWIGDTHGDAGIVIGPDTAYVFVAVLYARDWLEFEQSAPVIGELARLTWNALNPSQPVAAVTEAIVPLECDPANDPVMDRLLSASLPMIGP